MYIVKDIYHKDCIFFVSFFQLLIFNPRSFDLTSNSTAEMKSMVMLFKTMQTNVSAIACRTCRKYCTTEKPYTLTKKKEIHPYLRIHPWKSEKEFTKYLLKNIIYNAGRKLFKSEGI